MEYRKEANNIDDFEWWSGAKDRIDDVRSLPEAAQKEFWDFVEGMFEGETPTATEYNALLASLRAAGIIAPEATE